jgi:hypothetical protein
VQETFLGAVCAAFGEFDPLFTFGAVTCFGILPQPLRSENWLRRQKALVLQARRRRTDGERGARRAVPRTTETPKPAWPRKNDLCVPARKLIALRVAADLGAGDWQLSEFTQPVGGEALFSGEWRHNRVTWERFGPCATRTAVAGDQVPRAQAPRASSPRCCAISVPARSCPLLAARWPDGRGYGRDPRPRRSGGGGQGSCCPVCGHWLARAWGGGGLGARTGA